MTHSSLIIVVSDTFRTVMDLLNQEDSILLGPVKLMVHKYPEKIWHGKDGLASEIQVTLLQEREKKVRIAAHLKTCFGAEHQTAYQVRFHDEEKMMRDQTGIEELQVWGFRHEPGYSPIWDAMVAIRKGIEQHNLSGLAGAQLGQQLNDAFVQATARDLYEHITLFRHRILGLFVSVRLNLEIAAENAEREIRRDESALTNVLRNLPGKKMEALKILDEGVKQLEQFDPTAAHKASAQQFAVQDVLDDMPRLDDAHTASDAFNKWLARLDEALERLRSGLI